MRIFLVAGVVFGLVIAFTAFSPPVRAENCYVVRAPADARNPQLSPERAEHRLQRHIVRQVTHSTGKHVGPIHTHCIRNACESSAVICQH